MDAKYLNFLNFVVHDILEDELLGQAFVGKSRETVTEICTKQLNEKKERESVMFGYIPFLLQKDGVPQFVEKCGQVYTESMETPEVFVENFADYLEQTIGHLLEVTECMKRVLEKKEHYAKILQKLAGYTYLFSLPYLNVSKPE